MSVPVPVVNARFTNDIDIGYKIANMGIIIKCVYHTLLGRVICITGFLRSAPFFKMSGTDVSMVLYTK